MKHPTIHDVAARARVSKSLVSLVMRGAPNVSEDKRSAVLRAARDLGYRPNLAARSLVRRRSQIIGVFVSDLHNPFFHAVIDGIGSKALDADFHPLLTTGQLSTKRESRAIDTLLELRVDGLILLSPRVARSVITDVARTVPTVALGFTARSDVFDTIAVDESIGAGLVVDHLVGLGHRRIAHIHGGSGPGARPRRTQYERAMSRHGLESRITVAAGDFTEQGGIAGMRKLLKARSRPTAVFVANDFAALGALEVLDEAGIAVPQEMSIVGYDNVKEAGHRRIALTTVEQPLLSMGETALDLLLERLEEDRIDARHLVLPPRLMLRNSTGPPRRGR